jgi:hypothetical protein
VVCSVPSLTYGFAWSSFCHLPGLRGALSFHADRDAMRRDAASTVTQLRACDGHDVGFFGRSETAFTVA